MTCGDVNDNSCAYEFDCAGVCNGDAYEDDCGTCDNDSTNDCIPDDQDTPDWMDDPGAYEFTTWIVGGIVQSDGENIAEDGDMFVALDDAGNVHGVADQNTPPFGPYLGQIVYEMTMRSNVPGELLSFKYYDASENAVLDISETYTFVTNEQLGDVEEPVFYNILQPRYD